jgi:hypothetical protein
MASIPQSWRMSGRGFGEKGQSGPAGRPKTSGHLLAEGFRRDLVDE